MLFTGFFCTKLCHNSWYEAVFWIRIENIVGNTGVFSSLWRKALSAPHSAPPVTSLGAQRELGGDIAGTAGTNWPKQYSSPHDIMFSIKNWGLIFLKPQGFFLTFALPILPLIPPKGKWASGCLVCIWQPGSKNNRAKSCIESGQDEVNFLHCSLYDAVFWICD